MRFKRPGSRVGLVKFFTCFFSCTFFDNDYNSLDTYNLNGVTMQLNEITSKLYDFLNRSKAVFLTWDPTSFDSTTLAKLQIKL
ncbi:MAG: hypothetical protein RLZ10_2178, partial [Bacteroidota bacterium]